MNITRYLDLVYKNIDESSIKLSIFHCPSCIINIAYIIINSLSSLDRQREKEITCKLVLIRYLIISFCVKHQKKKKNDRSIRITQQVILKKDIHLFLLCVFYHQMIRYDTIHRDFLQVSLIGYQNRE